MSHKIKLSKLKTVLFESWREEATQHAVRRLCIVVSGYEARGRHWAQNTYSLLPGAPDTHWLVMGFEDFRDALSRPDNDKFYEERRLPQTPGESSELNPLLEAVQLAIAGVLAGRADAPAVLVLTTPPEGVLSTFGG